MMALNSVSDPRRLVSAYAADADRAYVAADAVARDALGCVVLDVWAKCARSISSPVAN